MKVDTSFTIPSDRDRAWTLLLDFRSVAGAMPGARLDSVDGDVVEGAVVVRLGPMKVEYAGTATVIEKDREAGRLVIKALGQEVRGNGTAGAVFVASLTEAAEGTEVRVEADVDVTGRAAQMGAGIVQDVARKITGEFAQRLRDQLVDNADAPSEMAAVQGAHDERPDVLNLGAAAAVPILRRAIVALLAVAGLGLLIWLIVRESS